MNLDELIQMEIKCFQHCSKDHRYLCIELPDKCPSCFGCLKSISTKFKVPPFNLPRPLSITTSKTNNFPPLSLLLQPTDGTYDQFIQKNLEINPTNHIEQTDIGNLHIGVTNSSSNIFDFDVCGLNRNSEKWFRTPSIVINLEDKIKDKYLASFVDIEFETSESDTWIESKNYKEKWDQLLEMIWSERSSKWREENYNEISLNCLDFIISFLLDYGFFDQYVTNIIDLNFCLEKQNSFTKYFLKNSFSRELIEPEFIKCLKYLNLLTKLKAKNFYLEDIK